MNWYYAQGEQRQGPVTETDFEALIAAGTITENTLVWKEGMANWAPLKEVRATGTPEGSAPPGWIRCSATGRFFPPEEIVYIDGKPYSAAAKAGVLQGVMQTGAVPTSLDTHRNGPAWEQRDQLGIFQALWQTVRPVLTEPSATFTNMKREGGLGSPLSYYVILGWVGVVLSMVYQLGMQAGVAQLTPNQSNNPLTFPMTVGILVGYAILMPLFIVVGSFIGAGILHLSLMICQGAKQPFETTFRTYCYVNGSTSALLIIPFCGAYAAGIWALVAMCIGIARTHEITTGRAVAAVLLPAAVCIGLVIVAIVVIAGIAAASQAHH